MGASRRALSSRIPWRQSLALGSLLGGPGAADGHPAAPVAHSALRAGYPGCRCHGTSRASCHRHPWLPSPPSLMGQWFDFCQSLNVAHARCTVRDAGQRDDAPTSVDAAHVPWQRQGRLRRARRALCRSTSAGSLVGTEGRRPTAEGEPTVGLPDGQPHRGAQSYLHRQP